MDDVWREVLRGLSGGIFCVGLFVQAIGGEARGRCGCVVQKRGDCVFPHAFRISDGAWRGVGDEDQWGGGVR